MQQLKFRVWHLKEQRMYFRGYQKMFHVLLCDDDHGANEGKGVPVKRAPYADCLLLESTSFIDKKGREIFEGDIVRVTHDGKTFEEVAQAPPDMFGSRKLHPLQAILIPHGIKGNPGRLDIEVLGNEFETPQVLSR